MTDEYYYLQEGDIIQPGDEVDASRDGWRNPPKWQEVSTTMIGMTASDPNYPSHTRFRRRQPLSYLASELLYAAVVCGSENAPEEQDACFAASQLLEEVREVLQMAQKQISWGTSESDAVKDCINIVLKKLEGQKNDRTATMHEREPDAKGL